MYRGLGDEAVQLLARNLAAYEQPCQALEGSMTPHHPATLGREPVAQPPRPLVNDHWNRGRPCLEEDLWFGDE